MGQDATATLSEIEAARQRLQRDIDVLEQRLRPGSDLRHQAIMVGGAATAAGAGLLVIGGAARRRLRRRAEHRHARVQAEALADVLAARDLAPFGRDDLGASRAGTTSTVALVAALMALAVSIAQFVARRADRP